MFREVGPCVADLDELQIKWVIYSFLCGRDIHPCHCRQQEEALDSLCPSREIAEHYVTINMWENELAATSPRSLTTSANVMAQAVYDEHPLGEYLRGKFLGTPLS